MSPPLTDRQREIDQGMGAREIARELHITRKVNPDVSDGDAATIAGTIQALNEIKYVRDQLTAIVRHLDSVLPS